MDPLRKGHCMLDFSIKDIAQGPKNYSPYSFNTLRTSEINIVSVSVYVTYTYYIPVVNTGWESNMTSM